eukprot:NODE_1381_length_1180_cov_135.166225_g1133_i0.p1 GENE.NODE_1381_length_1180_cov_135.166225_g1133_i0~~NODE_1381_length_1180_cov_135.166225_g1133_i0.p1  ORF type:complete len:155 (-),score=31.60 NODE_1381_length_1180_cov_135.166225_g1133_i0:238-702(-)
MITLLHNQQLSTCGPDIVVPPQCSLRRYILDHVQAQFYSSSGDAEELQKKKCTNAQFMGHLFRHEVLNGKIAVQIISELFHPKKLVDSLNNRMEVLCNLLRVAGDYFEMTNPTKMDKCFRFINQVLRAGLTSFRIRVVLENMVSLRANNWTPSK